MMTLSLADFGQRDPWVGGTTGNCNTVVSYHGWAPLPFERQTEVQSDTMHYWDDVFRS
jgi:hypothetical protein